jgi:hypothetical protein
MTTAELLTEVQRRTSICPTVCPVRWPHNLYLWCAQCLQRELAAALVDAQADWKAGEAVGVDLLKQSRELRADAHRLRLALSQAIYECKAHNAHEHWVTGAVRLADWAALAQSEADVLLQSQQRGVSDGEVMAAHASCPTCGSSVPSASWNGTPGGCQDVWHAAGSDPICGVPHPPTVCGREPGHEGGHIALDVAWK